MKSHSGHRYRGDVEIDHSTPPGRLTVRAFALEAGLKEAGVTDRQPASPETASVFSSSRSRAPDFAPDVCTGSNIVHEAATGGLKSSAAATASHCSDLDGRGAAGGAADGPSSDRPLYVPMDSVRRWCGADPRGLDRVLADPVDDDAKLPRTVPSPPAHHLLFTPRRFRWPDPRPVYDFDAAGTADTRDWCCRQCGLLSVGDVTASQHASHCDGSRGVATRQPIW